MSDATLSQRTIFLSYANADRERVVSLVAALESEGMDVWWDQEIPRGQNFNRVIEAALRQAKCAIVVWSATSITSEWVFNEASEARKRQILVPALIDDVEPPLEFRHLQAARLVGWDGDRADSEWLGLRDAVRGLLTQTSGPIAPAAIRTTPRPPSAERETSTWWRTPAGAAAGLGALLIGIALLLMALNQAGLVGGEPQPAASATDIAVESAPATVDARQPPASAPASSTESPGGNAASAGRDSTGAERVNVLDPAQGGMLVIANEDGWRSIIVPDSRGTVLSTKGFAVFAFRDEKPVRIDGVGAYVEATNGRNLKELQVLASDQSETGPFRKVALITVPNYRNMRGPVHEFPVPPFTARYVRLEIQGWQDGPDFPNGYVGGLRLYGYQGQ
jgi:hypothetical protein